MSMGFYESNFGEKDKKKKKIPDVKDLNGIGTCPNSVEMASKPSPVMRSTRKGSTGETASMSPWGGIGRWWVKARSWPDPPFALASPSRRCWPTYPVPPTTSTRFLSSPISLLSLSLSLSRTRRSELYFTLGVPVGLKNCPPHAGTKGCNSVELDPYVTRFKWTWNLNRSKHHWLNSNGLDG